MPSKFSPKKSEASYDPRQARPKPTRAAIFSPFVLINPSASSLKPHRRPMDNNSTYDPEIEARRGEYERLAEGLAHMAELHGGPRDRLDLEGFDAQSKNHLINGIDEHLYALWQNMD